MATAHSSRLSAFSASEMQRASNALAHCIGLLQACDSPAQQQALFETVRNDTLSRSMTISSPIHFTAPTQVTSSPTENAYATALVEQFQSSELFITIESGNTATRPPGNDVTLTHRRFCPL
mmetsp:Transcript_14555/g.34503  ORF Transcript_14555/g.34503 Transcript_14555/m.34503 type:complete len:121 (+) Transcript_14555:60-422(+)